MSQRMAKVNKHIQRTFGEILRREADLPLDVLVTISRVDTTPNLKRTTIWLYINPAERAEQVIEHVTPQLYDLQGAFNRALDLKPLPRVRLRIDYGADHAATIDQALEHLQ
jgi:ribosome-binding factor A